jgi:hypothetical protein
MAKFDRLLECFATLIHATPRSAAIAGMPHLPKLYAKLLENYSFPAFKLGPVLFFGTERGEFSLPQPFAQDKGIAGVLSRNSYVQVGVPTDISYDPVCLKLSSGRRDGALVRVDHEDTLLRERIKVVALIAPSFADFIERALAGQFGQPVDPME